MPGGLQRLDNQIEEGEGKETKRVGTGCYIGISSYWSPAAAIAESAEKRR